MRETLTQLRKYSLTFSQATVLVCLLYHGAVSVSRLHMLTGLPVSTIYNNINRLTRGGFVQKHAAAAGAQGAKIILTRRGRESAFDLATAPTH